MRESALALLSEHYQHRDRAARAWKANGGQVVGYLCDNVPEELIAAAGFLPYRLSGDPHVGREAVEQYVQPFALPFSARSQRPGFVEAMLDMLLAGAFDFVDFLVVPHTRKAIQAMYRELTLAGHAYPELALPVLEFLDRAYTPFFASEVFNRQRLVELKARLEEWSGRTVTTDVLTGAIALTNETRALLQQLTELRHASPPRLSGVAALRVIGAAAFMPKDEYNRLLRRALTEVGSAAEARDSVRLFVGGSPHEHTQLYEIVESCGATVVAEDHCWGTRLAEFPLDPSLDPFEALADRYHRKPACSIAFPLATVVDACTRRAVAANVDGAIFFVLRGDAGHVWDTPDEIRSLQANGIPSLYLAYQPYWSARPDELRASVGAFVSSIKRSTGAPA
jgi:benzoyl-CoA reductase/2-hydroxyglutaryl-CoA dehydratase subunit BcrC/BadD/HgdB